MLQSMPSPTAIVPFTDPNGRIHHQYAHTPGSIANDGRCGPRAILETLRLQLGRQQLLDMLQRHRIPNPPSLSFAWNNSRDLNAWIDALNARAFHRYNRLVYNTPAAPGDPMYDLITTNREYDRLEAPDYHSLRRTIAMANVTDPFDTTDAWMDHRLAIGLGALLNVNIRVQSATDGRITDAYTAADGNTVTLNYYPNLHYDIQQHPPNHNPPVRRNNADSGDATSASPRAPTNRQDRAGPAERTEAQDDANTSDDNNRDDGEAKPM